jgi:hypothetical protein
LIRPGDVLFFYMSKGESYASTQSMTTIGIADQVINVSTADDLVRHTANVRCSTDGANVTPRSSRNGFANKKPPA